MPCFQGVLLHGGIAQLGAQAIRYAAPQAQKNSRQFSRRLRNYKTVATLVNKGVAQFPPSSSEGENITWGYSSAGRALEWHSEGLLTQIKAQTSAKRQTGFS